MRAKKRYEKRYKWPCALIHSGLCTEGMGARPDTTRWLTRHTTPRGGEVRRRERKIGVR